MPKENPLEATSALPYIFGNMEISPTKDEWMEDSKTVRRECFKEAKNFNLKAEIANRISSFRDKFENQKSTKKIII